MSENLLQELLSQHDPDVQTTILEITRKTGITPNDPIFLLLLGTSTIQVLLKTAPQELKQTYEYCHQQVIGHLEQYEKAACRGIEAQVASMAERLVKKGGEAEVKEEVNPKTSEPTDEAPQKRDFFSKLKQNWAPLLIGSGTMLIMLSAGILSGIIWEKYANAQVGLDPIGKRQLTKPEAEALIWATSPDGQYAKQLMGWNDSLRGGQYQQLVDGLGIEMRYGTQKAKRGFCFLWVVPPEQRELSEK
jgi:hypothetical protein